MCFAQTNFPGQSRVLDGSQRRGAGSAVVPADGDYVRAGFCDSCRDDADACAGNQLHADTRPGIDGAQIVNQLRQVFNAVNIVMRRRRNQWRAGRGMANPRDVRGNFTRGKLAAFSGFRALGHFDFEFLGVNEIIRGDAEAAGGDLFNFVRGFGLIHPERGIFAAFAGVALAAELVHSERECAMGFRAERPQRHRLGAEFL